MKIKRYWFFCFLFLIINLSILDKSFALRIKNIHIGNTSSDRWIEVFNDGNDIADFTSTDYKILDNTSDSKRSIFEISGGNSFPKDATAYIFKTLSPVTKVSETLPGGVNLIFRSGFFLDENSGSISIINSNGSTIYACSSYGGVECGNNTSTTSTSTNTTSSSTIDNTNNTSNNIVYVYVATNNQNKYGDIQVLLPSDKVVPALADVDYTVKAIDSQRNVIGGLEFNWSFGDGGEKYGKDATYHYVYPGEYTLIATADGYTSGGQARMNVTVVTPDIVISKVGTGKLENYIDIENKTNYDLFLSNFYLNVDGVFYKLPKNLIIAKNKTIHLSGEAVGFSLPARMVSLHYPNKNLLVSYSYQYDANSAVATTTRNTSSTTKTVSLLENNFSKKSINIDKNLNTESPIKNIKVNNINKDVQNSIINMKKLILASDNNEKQNTQNTVINQDLKANQKLDNEVENNTKNNTDKNVDIGIIKWIKSLIY